MLRFQRDERREAVRQFAGRHWAEEAADEAVPLNLLGLYVSIMAAELVGQNPRLSLVTRDLSKRPMVRAVQDWANKEIPALRLFQTLRRVVTDALFSVGVCKVALATPAEAGLGGWNLKAGQPYCEAVDLDDFVVDMNARDWREVGYIGHRVRVPFEIVQGSRYYGPRRKDLTPTTENPFNLEGDERINLLGKGFLAGHEADAEDYVDLWEIYLPRHRVVLTLSDDQLTGAGDLDGKALHEQPWVGPDEGPYHVLGFGVVPGNLFPKAPVQDLLDLHLTENNVLRKVIRQAQRMKQITMFQSPEDARRLQEADDGDLVRSDNPQGTQAHTSGGADQGLFLLIDYLKQLFSYAAGNLDILGGMAPQSRTLGQDRLLAGNASRVATDKQEAVIDYSAAVMKALCWYWWKDPFRVMSTTFSVPGMPEISVGRQVGPADRQAGRFEDLDISVEPYSLRHKTPADRMQSLMGVVTQVVLPMAQTAQAQGVQLDMNALLQKLADYMDMPDLPDILTVAEPPETDSQAGGDGPQKPQNTQRNYVRENVPMRTEQGDSQNLRNSLLGVNPGGAQRNGTSQGVGA